LFNSSRRRARAQAQCQQVRARNVAPLLSARTHAQAPARARFFAASSLAQAVDRQHFPQNLEKPGISPRWGIHFPKKSLQIEIDGQVLLASAPI